MVHRKSTPETNNKEPPDYEPSSTVSEAGKDSKSARATTPPPPPDDPSPNLKDYQTSFLLDDSGSMRTRDRTILSLFRRKHSRWELLMRSLSRIIPILGENPEGVDLYFLNNANPAVKTKGLKSAEEVASIVQSVEPSGLTPMGSRLQSILGAYLDTYKRVGPDGTKCLNLIVITDGKPDHQNEVMTVIKDVARRLDYLGARKNQLGIQFVQIGTDKGATAFLETLDDGLDDRLRDIVDTTPYSSKAEDLTDEEWLLKVVTGAIHKNVDNKKLSK